MSQAHSITVSPTPARTPGTEPPSSGIVSGQSKSGTHTFDRLPDSLLERCTLIAPLGKGGMAEVFLAACDVAPHERRPVVIKRLYPHWGDDASVVQMFMDEARLVCCLEHENIVKTLEVGTIGGRCCIAMEYLVGQPLQRLMRRTWRSGGLSIDLAVYIAIRILEALEYAHEARDHQGRSLDIVHRDISPHNILITNSGLVKVLDFGIAKAKSHEGRTAAGLIKGKFAYLAPEQAYGQSIDRRADIWSTGVVLWEMLCGTRLFRADNEAATLRATLRAEIPDVSTLRTEVQPALDQIISRALQRHPNLRYRNATQMKHELQSYLTSLHQCPTGATLASLVRDLFPGEIAQQQQLAHELTQTQNYTDPETPEASANTHVTPGTGATSIEVSHITGLMRELSQRNRVAFRGILVVLFTSVAVTSFLVSLLFSPFSRRSTAPSVTNKSSLRAMPVSADVILGPVSIEDDKSTPEPAASVDTSPEPSAGPTTLPRNASGASGNPVGQWHWAAGAPSARAPNAVRKPAKQKTLPPTRNYGI